MQVLKVNPAIRRERKVYQDPADGTASREPPVHQVQSQDPSCISQSVLTCTRCLMGFAFVMFCSQVTQVSPDSLVSLVYREGRVNLASLASDSLDPQELKVKTPSLLHPPALSIHLFFLPILSPCNLSLLPHPPSFPFSYRIPRYPRAARISWRTRQTRSRWIPRPAWNSWIQGKCKWTKSERKT